MRDEDKLEESFRRFLHNFRDSPEGRMLMRRLEHVQALIEVVGKTLNDPDAPPEEKLAVFRELHEQLRITEKVAQELSERNGQ